ncbi:retroviral aspartyl protease [Ostertagia ostertagi]
MNHIQGMEWQGRTDSVSDRPTGDQKTKSTQGATQRRRPSSREGDLLKLVEPLVDVVQQQEQPDQLRGAGWTTMKTGKAYCKLCLHVRAPIQGMSDKEISGTSRQVHWCAEQDDSDDEDNQEVTISNVQAARCRNHVQTSSQSNGNDSGRKEKFEKPLSNSNRGSIRTRMTIEPAIMLPIMVNGRTIEFELDTGASVSIIDEATWSKIGKPEMKPTKLEATAYNNSPISFEGRCRVELQFKGRVIVMEVYVLRTASHPLCGRDMIRGLQIDCGPHVKNMEEKSSYTKEQLREKIKVLLEENRMLFEKGLGRCTTAKVALKLKRGLEKPKFCRVRPIPIALRPKVEAKLQELMENEWATPLVVVPKPGGKIRLCGDYKVTVNPQLDINQYPLPKPDDLFHMLNGGKKFSKMDLSDAYMQLELEPESKKYTACEICATFGNEMVKTPLHPWDAPGKVWQRLHMDFAETTDGRRWLVMVDAKSKWPEVVQMKSTTVERTIEKLKDILVCMGYLNR